MKKLLIIMLSFISSCIVIAQDIKLDELLEKNLKTIGQDKMAKIQSVKITGKMTQSGVEFQYYHIQKHPNLDREELELQGTRIIFARDGETFWMINPFTGSSDPQDMPDELVTPIKKLTRSDPNTNWENPFVNWKESENKIELVGREDMGGTSVYNLKLTFKDNDVVNYYMDATKFVVLKMKTRVMALGQTSDQEISYSDFRDVDGILVPFKIEVLVNGQTSTQLTVDKCEFNLPVDDTIFIKPALDKK